MSISVVCDVTNGPDSVKKIWLSSGKTVLIGRSTTTDYAFTKDSKMSSVHFRLSCSEAACMIEDMGSTNGTKLNDAPVTKEQISSGDKIVAGSTTFKVKIEQQSTTSEKKKPRGAGGTLVSPVKAPPDAVHPKDDRARPKDDRVASTNSEPNADSAQPDADSSKSESGDSDTETAPPISPEPNDSPEDFGTATEASPSYAETKLTALGVSPKIAALVSTVKSNPDGLPIAKLMEMLKKPDHEFTPLPSSKDDETSTTDTTDANLEWGPGVKLIVQINTPNVAERVVAQRIGQVMTFGKSSECDCTIESDEALAPRQFLISCNNSQSMLFHFDADIPTLVNGTSVKQYVLQHRTLIEAGNSQFRINLKQ